MKNNSFHIELIILMLLIVAITVSGCRKDKSVLPCNNNTEPCVGDCLNDVDIATLTFGYVPDYYGIHYVSPFYNPLNNDEFVYGKLNYDLVSGSLNVYNIVTGIKTELWNSSTFSGGLIGQPKWTRSNWIVFGGSDMNIWKVRPDGSNLTQLSFTGDQREPEVNYDGTEVIAFVNALGCPRMTINGTPIDTLYLGPKGSWNEFDEIAAPYAQIPGEAGVGLFDIGLDTVTQINTWGFTGSQDQIENLKWHPNNEDIYYTKWSNGLYKVNKTDKSEELIRTGCFRHFYPSIAVSNDGLTILACKLEVDSITPSDELAISQYLVMFDINGCNEQVVHIP